ncbi:MAG: elongation factor P maturation arginine rhamnosyltransferase EarP [Limnohabitans sp.]|nr:elongation factor P maturation arginine rhamnosyltransferase EarP [Limnohabitans sp.]
MPQSIFKKQAIFSWDIFCRVVDNFGDIGVAWRLSADLAHRGHRVRLWVDDASALSWMAPLGHPLIQVLPWSNHPLAHPDIAHEARPMQAVIEMFGCELPDSFQQAMKSSNEKPIWINLEYLSAEPYVERMHTLESPVLHGTAQGLKKIFFYPGFTHQTGGLIREQSIQTSPSFSFQSKHLKIFLFCYEPTALDPWLKQLNQMPVHIELRVTQGRAQNALERINTCDFNNIQINNLPFMTQELFDQQLRECDFNCVRGEDSWIRVIWAGKPFLWQIYPQDDGVHLQKLESFLDLFKAPQIVRQAHRVWNNTPKTTHLHPFKGLQMPELTPANLKVWTDWVRVVQSDMMAPKDLTSQLIDWTTKSRLK